MLVLSRKLNESIIIDDQIKITIVEIRGDKIRIGIEAPKNVAVHRREIYDAIQRQISIEEETAMNPSSEVDTPSS